MGLCFLSAAALSAGLTRFQSGVAFIWLANAILLGVLHCSSPSVWGRRICICGIASFVATSLFGMGLVAALPLALVNVGEAVAGARLLRWLNKDRISLNSGREIAGLLAVAIVVPAIFGIIGAAITNIVTHQDLWRNWLAWTSGHALGVLIVTPLTVFFLSGDIAGRIERASRAQRLHGFVLLMLLASTSVAAFAQNRFPLLFLPYLPLVLCVFRMGRIGACLSLGLLTIIASSFTLADLGPMQMLEGGPGEQAQFLQLYLAVATLIALPAAAELKRRHQLYSELERNAAVHRVIIDRTGDLLMTTSVDGTITYTSPSVRLLTGYSPAQLVGRQVQELIVEEDRQAELQARAAAIRDPDRTVLVEYRARRSSGEIGWFESHIRAVLSDSGESGGAVSIVREISDRKAREFDLAAAATTDALTGLANRRVFESAFHQLLEQRAGGLIGCLAVFDLDHFKLVNDLHGHAAGDAVLRAFASIVTRETRKDDVAARIGGEEFAILLTGADLEVAQEICDRIRRVLWAWSVAAPTGAALRPTVSVGLTAIREASTCEEALAAADRALYRAKRQGRNTLAVAA